MEIDRFDRQLLNLVQQDSSQTAERLAEQVPLSPSAIQRRLRRMREKGVILRDCAIIDPNKIDRSMVFIASIHVERERPELLGELRNWLKRQLCVQQAYYVTGEADFVLIVTAADAESYDEFMTRLVGGHPNVKRFTTNVSLGLVKRGLTIPVALDDLA